MTQERHFANPLREAVESVNLSAPTSAPTPDKPGVKHNVSPLERQISVAAGAALAVAGLTRINSIAGLVTTGIAASLLYRGVSGNCAIYKALGVSTNNR